MHGYPLRSAGRAAALLLVLAAPIMGAQALFYGGVGLQPDLLNLNVGLNRVVEEYNITRPWLDDKLETPWYLGGLALCAGTAFVPVEGFGMDIEFSYAFTGTLPASATGTPPLTGEEATRDIYLSGGEWFFSFSYLPFLSDVASPSFGVTFGETTNRLMTRSDRGDPFSLAHWDDQGLLPCEAKDFYVGPFAKLFLNLGIIQTAFKAAILFDASPGSWWTMSEYLSPASFVDGDYNMYDQPLFRIQLNASVILGVSP